MFCLTEMEFLYKRDRVVMSAGIHVRYHVSVLTQCLLNSSPVLTGRLQISLLILSKFQRCNQLLFLMKSLEKLGIPEKRDPGPQEDPGSYEDPGPQENPGPQDPGFSQGPGSRFSGMPEKLRFSNDFRGNEQKLIN